jgi:membrane-bound inhibitor of C-type lysozyme
MSNSRRAALGGESVKNPATKFFNWKSNEQNFSYYDKEKTENVSVPLSFKFLVLKQLQSVKGWSDALSGSIISNEVEFVGTQEINAVCYHKNLKGEATKTTIAKGLYSNIKDAIVSAGAKYHKSIYIMLEDGSLANIQLKGASVKEWGDFFNKNKSRLTDEWVVVESAKAGKKGAVKFWTPEFKLQSVLTEIEVEQADTAFDELDAYLQVYLAKATNNIPVVEPEIVSEGTDEDDEDLAF